MQLSIAGVLFFEVGEELAEPNDEFEPYVEVLFDMGWHLRNL